VARFRLRFLLQEFDLSGTEVLLGRSPDCQITIEDPLVSREHARIVISGDSATISDLGSRNGVRINGGLIEGVRDLKDGDRIRLGTQELVFSVVKARKARAARPTGFMTICKACNTPYPEQSPQCPHCGHAPGAEESDEDTISGLVVEPKHNWTFQLLGEVIERAIAAGRAEAAEKLMRRAVREIEEQTLRGVSLDPNQVAMISGYALRLAKLLGGVEWVEWSLVLHERHGLIPSALVIDRIEALDATPETKAAITSFLKSLRDSGKLSPDADLAGVARLEKLKR